jgi:hypothetical protein
MAIQGRDLITHIRFQYLCCIEKRNTKQEGNLYDKIVKENIESIIPALMNSVLGFKVAKAEVIREKLQQIKEKEADALRIATDPNGQKFMLHSLRRPGRISGG